MESRLPVTPLPPHHGRHAGLVSFGLMGVAGAFLWLTHDTKGSSSVDPRPAPAASVPQPAPEPPRFPPIELGPGIETATVAERAIPRIVTATGAVTFDENRTHHVGTPVPGLLVKTRPASLGRVIRAGETVAVVYSVDVYKATQDLLAQVRDFKTQELLDRERMRLLRWGMRQSQITRIEQAMEPTMELPIIARTTGTVVVENGAALQLAEPSNEDLLTITDPRYATIYIEVPMADADLVKVGQAVRVTLDQSKRAFAAPVGYISRKDPRGMKIVRVDLAPNRVKMPPEVGATIELARVIAKGAAIPEAAVLRDGERTVVYVAGDGTAAARDVRVGAAADGFVLVESGLEAGETIVVRR